MLKGDSERRVPHEDRHKGRRQVCLPGIVHEGQLRGGVAFRSEEDEMNLKSKPGTLS